MNATLTVTPLGVALLTWAGGDTDGPAGSAVVALDGGVRVWVDPLTPDGIRLIQVSPDEGVTGDVLAALVGPDAARRLIEIVQVANETGDTSDEEQRTELAVELGPAVVDVARLGFLLWLEQNAIRALDSRALDLEIGVVAARLDMLGAGGLAEERLNSGFNRLLELSGVETGVSRAPAGTLPLLSEALELVGSSFSEGLSEDFVAMLESTARSLLAAQESNAVVRDHDETLMELVTLRERARGFSLVAGFTAGESVTEGSYSVDWRQVPRNVLDCSEETVQATWNGPDDATLDVVVRALDPADPNAVISNSLMFRAVMGDNDEPVAAGELVFDTETGMYRGSCFFDRDLGDVYVDVFSVMSVLPAATGALRSRRAAMRHAATALQYERVPGVDPRGCAEAAAPLWREAASRFRDADSAAGKGTEDGESAQAADRRVVMLDQVATDSVRTVAWIAALPKVTLAEALWFDSLRTLAS